MRSSNKLTTTQWLIIIVASIGFLFDTYELLMTPLVARPAIAELLHVPPNNAAVTEWLGRLLWMTALCGGIFGLIGGWLTDKIGRKTVMVASIFVYSLSPVLAAFSTSLAMFVFFRCLTFIGVCVEFIAAITWLSELFSDKKQRARLLGTTQAFASLGGVMVSQVNKYVIANSAEFPALGLPVGQSHDVSTWRYMLLTGLIPAIPIALLLFFVPESAAWKEKRAAGTLQRPNFGALFTKELRRVTLLTAALSACAYAIAFGALQVTVSGAVPALPELSSQAKELAPLIKEGKKLNKQFDDAQDPAQRKELLTQIKANLGKQKPLNDQVQMTSANVQSFQETGGLLGRIVLALLLFAGLARRSILKIFQFPSVLILPLTYFVLFKQGGSNFMWAYGLCGFLTVAQFSYFGEYLPKVFPLHLRGTGGSFATNVGGRMIGTSASLVTTAVLAPMIAGGMANVKPMHVAQAAGYLATGVAILALILGLFLPEPQDAIEA